MTGRRLVLGVDGGGTRTTAWLADFDRTILGRGEAGPANIKAVGAAAALEALDRAISTAFDDAGIELQPIDATCLGLAGWDRPEDRDGLRRWAESKAWAGELILVNDGDLVVAAGTPEGWGVGVIAGTGSIAVGRDAMGRTARAGGWGFVFGDEGSGYAVAVAALQRIARRFDGREPAPTADDPLTREVCGMLGIAGPGELVRAVYAEGFDRARVARLARAVVQAAEDDPTIAREILEPAGRELAAAVLAVAAGLGWRSGDVLPLAMAGGLLVNCPIVARALVAAAEAGGFHVDARSVVDPVLGAVVLAHRVLKP